MAWDGIGETPSPYQRLFQAVSEAVSYHAREKDRAGVEGQSLRNGCKFAVARGDYQPDKEMLRRTLSWAVYNGNSSLVEEVVLLGATVSCTEDDDCNSGYRLLLWAAYNGNDDIVSWLLVASAGGGGLQGRSMALEIACVMGRLGVVVVLLADGTDPSPSAFEIAAEYGHVGVMRVLLHYHARGASAECGDFAGGIDNALRTVLRSPNSTDGVINFLVNEAGANVNARNDRGDTLLHEAVYCDSVEAVLALLRHGAKVEAVNEKGDTPLLDAEGYIKQSVFEALAEAGANIHHRNSEGLSVLDMTAISGNLETLGALVRRKVDVCAVGPTGWSALDWAAFYNHEAAIDALVAAGADVNAKSGVGGQTPLHRAMESRVTPETFAALFRHGADVGALDERGNAPLHLASQEGETSSVAALVAAGADINRRTSQKGWTALDWAAFLGNVDVLKMLVENGADVRGSGPRGDTPLHLAVVCESMRASEASCEAIIALLLHGAEVDAADKKGDTPLVTAVKGEQLAVVDALVAGGADVNRRNVVDDKAPLDVAASIGNLGVLKALIRHGVDVNASNAKGRSPLYEAAARNRVAAIHALVEAGADVHGLAQEWTPLDASCQEGAADAIATLAELGADLTKTNVNGLIPLEVAVHGGHLDAVNALLAAGADPNQESGGKRVLYTAILSKRSDILATLLLHGADVNKEVVWDKRGLNLAVELQDAGMVNDLLGAGADVNHGVSYEDMTALHIACMLRSTDIMLTLLSHGASIGARDMNGMSPLHHAAYFCVRLYSSTDRVDVLLKAGADETARDCDGLTPAEFAGSLSSDETDRDALARVTIALERAPADRAWRRRGMVLLCRFFLEREAKQPESLVETAAQMVRRAEVGGCKDGDEAARKAGAGRLGKEEGLGNFGGLITRLFALEEEGLFRTVVGFL